MITAEWARPNFRRPDVLKNLLEERDAARRARDEGAARVDVVRTIRPAAAVARRVVRRGGAATRRPPQVSASKGV